MCVQYIISNIFRFQYKLSFVGIKREWKKKNRWNFVHTNYTKSYKKVDSVFAFCCCLWPGNSIKAKSPFSCYLHDNLTKNLVQPLSPVRPNINLYICIYSVHCIMSYQNKSHSQHFEFRYVFILLLYVYGCVCISKARVFDDFHSIAI